MKTEFTLFSQMYSCYYQVVRHILSQASGNFLTKQQMKEIADTYSYQESALSIIPSMIQGDWPFLEKIPASPAASSDRYRSRLTFSGRDFPTPLTALQKA